MKEAKFRSALNGFNRTDVVDYIRAINEEHAAEKARLQQGLREANEEVAKLRGDAGARERAEELEKKLAETESRAAAAEKDLADQKLVNEEQEMRLRSWEPEIRAYQEFKSRFADIEMEARARSTAYLRRAEQQAAESLGSANSAIAQAAADFDRTRDSAQQTIARIRAELEQMQKEFQDLSGMMDEDSAALHAIHAEREEMHYE